MADATVSVLMTAEEARLHQAVMSAAAAFAQLDTGVAKVAKTSREAAKEEEALGRAAKRVFDETRTPQEQYNARMEKLNALVRAGVTDQETFRRKAKDLGDELKASGNKGVEAFGSKAVGMVKEFAGALGIGFGVAGAVRLIKDEWEAVIKVQERALEATLPVANAQRKFRGAAGFASSEEAAAFDAKIQAASTASGVTPKDLYIDAAAAMKERGMLSKAQTMQAVATGAKLFPADSADRREFIKSAMGMQEATGWSGQRAAGTLLAGAQRAGMSVPSMAPLLNALPGEDPLKVMALAQGLRAATEKDPGKAVIKLFKAIEDLGDTFDERLAAARANPELVGELVENMGFKGKFNPFAIAAEQFLTGTGAATEHVDRALASQISEGEAGKVLAEQAGVMGGGGIQTTSAFKRGLVAVKEEIESSEEMQPNARMAVIAENFKPLLEDLGEYSTIAKLSEFAVRISPDQIGAVKKKLVKKQEELRNPTKEYEGLAEPFPGAHWINWGSGPTMTAPTQKALWAADQTQKIIDVLTKVQKAIEENTAQTKPPTKPTLAPVNSRN